MKHTLHLAPVNGGPFNCAPAREIELDADRIATTADSCGIRFPWESHPYNVRLFVIGNEYGACGAVWASNEQDAFDELCDRGLSAGLMLDEEDVAKMDDDERESVTGLGNAGEPHNLDNAWIQVVAFDAARDIKLIVALAEARGANASLLCEV